MLAWVVIDRTYSRQFLPKSSSLRTLCLCVEFSDSLRPTSVVPTTYALTLATAAPQPFCNQSVTHSFYLDGGYTSLCGNLFVRPSAIEAALISLYLRPGLRPNPLKNVGCHTDSHTPHEKWIVFKTKGLRKKHFVSS